MSVKKNKVPLTPWLLIILFAIFLLALSMCGDMSTPDVVRKII
jgi:hypothetical protein